MILSRTSALDHFNPIQESPILWPYRTTSLVLPGAKVKRDAGHDTYVGDPSPDERRTGPYRTTPLVLPGAKITRDAGHDTSLGEPNPDELKTGPYRTTPLVCPEPKATRDIGHTESYLRHHPNPAMRAPPGHAVDPDHYFKSKVANTVLQRIQMDDPNKQVVHKQFNSPIHMYSDANIADTLQKQGVRVRKPVKYNPAESETYRAVQEEQLGDHVQEFSAPAQPRVFTSHKPAQVKVADPAYHLPRKTVNSVGENPEIIHQSGSFKRLMWNVMAESNY